MKAETKQLRESAELLKNLLKQIREQLPEEMFADIWERANEAEILLSNVISENKPEQTENEFMIY